MPKSYIPKRVPHSMLNETVRVYCSLSSQPTSQSGSAILPAIFFKYAYTLCRSTGSQLTSQSYHTSILCTKHSFPPLARKVDIKSMYSPPSSNSITVPYGHYIYPLARGLPASKAHQTVCCSLLTVLSLLSLAADEHDSLCTFSPPLNCRAPHPSPINNRDLPSEKAPPPPFSPAERMKSRNACKRSPMPFKGALKKLLVHDVKAIKWPPDPKEGTVEPYLELKYQADSSGHIDNPIKGIPKRIQAVSTVWVW
ncbi:uncharacterized protein BDR25DRAFT_360933 [Lindgomyces ingoldianus]|uniref:Uncharacterized protein n=1 Tax=Lindgomyces ingoldianus TaxID=673940 RepID=A0ACB6QDQ2_9PLEO|nr:uncharacterized protein BDR25DRAFT_360933 [Lindgomyces ingoldianus]KAF2465026.1 hypothetical protein BDR25DRAFT_360933 [Lindgomyces ingoldianus]